MEEGYNVLPSNQQKAWVLVPAVQSAAGRPRRVTGGVLKWSLSHLTKDNISLSIPFVVAYLPQGPMCLRFDTGIGALVNPNTGLTTTPGSGLVEPNQYVLAQGIFNLREQGSVVVSCRSSNISPGDSIVLFMCNRNPEDVALLGDVIFQYWSS